MLCVLIALFKNHSLQIIKAVPSKLCEHSQEMKTLKELRGIVIAVLFWTTQHWIAVSNVKCRDMPESTKGCFGFFFFKKALEHTAIGEGDRENLSVPSARRLPANHCHNYKRNSPSTHAALKISMGRKKYSLNPLWWAMLKGYPKWKKKDFLHEECIQENRRLLLF